MKKQSFYAPSPKVHQTKKNVRYSINCYEDRTIRGDLSLSTHNKKFVDLFEKFLVENQIEYTISVTTTEDTYITHE